MANAANVSYPTIVPTSPVGGGVGLPTLRKTLPATMQQSDKTIRGGLVINPAYAPFYVQGGYNIEAPRNNAVNQPAQPATKTISQDQAAKQSPSYWDSRPWAKMDPRILFGIGRPEQKPAAKPWIKKFIPPLALFNDASQWVNILMFNKPMQRTGNGNSMPAITGVYLGSQPTPPVITNNLAAGTLNAQLQLGTLAIQAQQLTMTASNYFGGA